MNTAAPPLTRLSDADLIVAVSKLVAREREATADLVEALMELDIRRLYLGAGCHSLFAYCTMRLRLSESAAYVRIEAARAFPLVLDHLRAGSLTLTAVKLLAPHLTEANHRPVVAAAAGCTTEQVKELVARVAPRPDVPASIRRLPEPRFAPPEHDAREAEAPILSTAPVAMQARPLVSSPTLNGSSSVPLRPAVVQPLAPTRYQLQMTVSADTRAKLRQLQDLLRGEIPSGDPAAIVDRALSLLLEHVAQRKCAATKGRQRPADDEPPTARATEAAIPAAQAALEPGAHGTSAGPAAAVARNRANRRPRSRHIPAVVKRQVWARDAGRCSYVSPAGERCASRTFLEFHHQVPVADGGPPTVENVRLLCSGHHDAESARVFDWRRIPAARPGAVQTRFRTSSDHSAAG